MKYEIKNRWTGDVIFTADIECSKNDSEGFKLGLAVKCAVKAGANLACANLADAYLAGANLADAYLARANLSGANLAGAYLADAYLADVKAYGYTFNRAPIQISNTRYNIEIWEGFMKIGCEKHTLAEWKKFTQKQIIKMDGKEAAIWWKKWKVLLFAIAEAERRTELPNQESEAA